MTLKMLRENARQYDVVSLLSKGSANTKTAKSDRASLGYLSAIQHFAPFNESGYQVCPKASDIVWEKIFPDMFEKYSQVQFYDYTKISARFNKRWKLPKNYHLTFSRSESNDKECLEVLRSGGNVAIVFGGELPKKWRRFKVIDGDKTDLRFLDKRGTVVGLTAKGEAKKDKSGFVV